MSASPRISAGWRPLFLRHPALRTPRAAFCAGLLLRLVYVTAGHAYRFSAVQDHFKFGYEMARIARSLVEGEGYANPFGGHTGPTAWIAPLYPLLIAVAFKLCGVYSPLSAWTLLAVNSLFSAATAWPIYSIADRCFGSRTARWAAWLWALYPPAMQFAVRWVWETAISTFLFTASVDLALRLRGAGERGEPETGLLSRWLLFGGLWGAIALLNPTLLLFLPFCGVWILAGERNLFRNRAKSAGRAALAALLFFACIAPWTWRNWRRFHAFVPLRSNFGAELYAGNGPGAMGFRFGALIGLPEDDPQHILYAKMGELAYVRSRGRLAEAAIAADPGRFAGLSLKRFYFFWASVPHPQTRAYLADFLRQATYCFASLAGILGAVLALRRRAPGAWLMAAAFALCPLTYYFVTVEARFRNPLEPLMAILAVYLFQSADGMRASRVGR
jgi:hypothetical protein